MKNLLPKVLFYYCALAAVFITATSALSYQKTGPLIFTFLFLPVTAYFIIELLAQVSGKSKITLSPRKIDVIIMEIAFLLLLGLGVKNLYAHQASEVSTPTSPLVFDLEKPTPAPSAQGRVQITEDKVNIRQNRDINSLIIGTATTGETYDYLSKTEDWYEIKFAANQTGFVSAKYIKEIK